MADGADVRTGRDDAVRSVDRALSILQVIARSGPMGVSEIALAVGVHKSTAFRLLGTLEARGFVRQSHERGEYRLGQGVVQLAAGAAQHHDINVIARDVTQRLAETVGETVNTAIHDGTAVISIDQHIGPAAVSSINWVGRRGPLHATAAGKLFLAFPDGDGFPAIPVELGRFSEHTIVDHDQLAQDLEQVRARGWSLSSEEQEAGLIAVGAPVRDFAGVAVAAVVVSGPAYRLTADAVENIAKYTVAAAEEISLRNGRPKRG
ncbi:IclR family transcriptional regulator [Pseudonocardia sp.]|uniref:IclR family transcriptional regulator n=1 Tax=Pseudonocardia sp. TaxID=60912 RepID=UPI003D143EBD